MSEVAPGEAEIQCARLGVREPHRRVRAPLGNRAEQLHKNEQIESAQQQGRRRVCPVSAAQAARSRATIASGRAQHVLNMRIERVG